MSVLCVCVSVCVCVCESERESLCFFSFYSCVFFSVFMHLYMYVFVCMNVVCVCVCMNVVCVCVFVIALVRMCNLKMSQGTFWFSDLFRLSAAEFCFPLRTDRIRSGN